MKCRETSRAGIPGGHAVVSRRDTPDCQAEQGHFLEGSQVEVQQQDPDAASQDDLEDW